MATDANAPTRDEVWEAQMLVLRLKEELRTATQKLDQLVNARYAMGDRAIFAAEESRGDTHG